ncbi:hypothetical protein A1Q1_02851 [Trichosporon asahii var. asahii CBS 2479]|uniref:NADPH:adrenodoxin oxidoreductase, mitochondrial n=1 Tax=Trichosporon asahii var. asahii (strain ATCC 90039 / CBS 2479 / JCM 2466 / KCTC 7840 / NBRC 103889/ NCYC 2677 / UAMH 7654) TaxID=1186058 RepID=J6EZ62_TRIAS|nr:hypothetical protein A1Q1_02851 [Trichosporon asahii var. asahii CBS 2479]EJT48147.1 hypothetical protein A1Q1_02851 [Trichosporon asahii var. asahii CBS 2479]
MLSRLHHLRLPPRALSRVRGYASSSDPIKVAVIGSGPSGFYTASRLLQLLPADSPLGSRLSVDMYERLPTPYGLSRYGVAPDHPEVKATSCSPALSAHKLVANEQNCQHKFDEMTQDPRFTFLGNVCIGDGNPDHSSSSPPAGSSAGTVPHIPTYTYPSAVHLPLASLKPYYNVLILSYGASLSNPLGIPGTDLGNVFPALAFVSWYNGHPAYADLPIDLSNIKSVDVVGQGNVALDVGRMLLQPVSVLEKSDIPQSVIDTLAKKAVDDVRIVGRRGPAQVAFTTKELREMTKLPGINYPGLPPDLQAAAKEATKGDRMRTRQLGLMEKPLSGPGGRFAFEFLRSPIRFNPSSSNSGVVGSVEWGENELVDGGRKAKSTGRSETRDTDMVIESVGYKSEPISDFLPHATGKIVNDAGRVRTESGLVPRVYTTGWVARGPVGVIASTMQDAYAVADNIIDDLSSSGRQKGEGERWLPDVAEGGRPDEVERGLKEGKVIDVERWGRVDKAERELGKKTGREEREKFRTVEEMLAAAN